MKRQNRNKFLFVFYPEKDGKYSVLSPDFLSATCGEGKSHSRRMAGDLAEGLLDLEDYKHLEDPTNRKSHVGLNVKQLYYDRTGQQLNEQDVDNVFWKYVEPKLYICNW